ncbi:MAG: gamma-glutamylcyclotransferase [Comamonadaceae bacterium]|nr:MAG: gamma-glutamylcyclotransferase [Comamonadaceae bacterium]
MPEGPASERLVFVYGTLRQGECNDIARYRPAAAWVGMGTTGGVLYDLGPYPGATFGEAGRILGEVYRVAPAVEAQLDALEGVQPDGEGEYRKREVLVQMGLQRLLCLAYEIHPARLEGAAVMAAGDWLLRARG